jgi:hypothetical protein
LCYFERPRRDQPQNRQSRRSPLPTASSRLMVTEAERCFPFRIKLAVRRGGLAAS